MGFESLFSMAHSAIKAGDAARKARNVKVTTRSWKVRYETVLSDPKKNDSTRAESWIGYWGSADKKGAWADEALGGGTPLACLYLLGWYFGKNPCGLAIAGMVVMISWGQFVLFSLAHDTLEMWTKMMVVLLFSVMFFAGRIITRTPPGMHHSKDVWVALVIETLLANSLTCLLHGVGARQNVWILSLSGSARFMRYGVFVSPFFPWYILYKKALDLQAAVLRIHNMCTGGGEREIFIPEGGGGDVKEVCECIVEIIRRSRDLRFTGLKKEALENLASMSGVGTKEARYIRFFTRGRERQATFNLLRAFHEGYSYNLTNDDNAGKFRDLIDKWFVKAHRPSASPWAAIKLLQNEGDEGYNPSLRRTSGYTRTESQSQNWWLCGAIAKVCDLSTRFETSGTAQSKERSIHPWYALFAAALTVDRNPTAIILAMEVDQKRVASDMRERMKKGCEHVLKYLSNNKLVYEDRGIIFTTAEAPSTENGGTGFRGDDYKPVVKYSAAGVWKAEQSREPVMLEMDAFDRLWRDFLPPPKSNSEDKRLTPADKVSIIHKSVGWSKKVIIHVDFSQIFDSLGLEASTSTRVRAAACQGWCMHSVWVSTAIYIHFNFTHVHIVFALFSLLALSVSAKDQYSYVFFVGLKLWRTFLGRVCRLPIIPSMSDRDICSLARYGFWAVAIIVNVCGSLLGCEYPTTLGRELLYFFLMLGSVAPGFWYFIVCSGGPGRWLEGDDTVIVYEGRQRGKGYEHRDSKESYRPLGKIVLTRDVTSL